MNNLLINRNTATASEIPVFQLVTILPDAAFLCDPSGKIVACSELVVPFFGIRDKSRVIGSSLQSFFAYEYIDEAYFQLLSAAHESGSRKSGKYLVRKGLKESLQSLVTFAAIAGEAQSATHVLVTFREAPVASQGSDNIRKKDIRLSRLFESTLNTSSKPEIKIQSILSQIGETLGAVACNFSQLSGDELLTVASWESPFNSGIPAGLCNKQLFDYLNEGNESMACIHKPMLQAFLDSEPNCPDENGVKTVLGLRIVSNAKVTGIISAVFTVNYLLSEIDRQFLNTVSSILGSDSSVAEPKSEWESVSIRQLLDCFSDPVYLLSLQGVILEVNKGLTEYYGYEREELIGKTPMLLSAESKNSREEFDEIYKKVLNGEPQKFEWWGKGRSGEIAPKEVKLSRSIIAGKDVLVAISRDITDSKKVEAELLRYNEELKESNISKDKFFSILAHDLKNPFQGLLGFIDLLYEDLDELTNTQIKEYLSNVRNASYHTYALLENLLEWSRIQSGKMPFTPSVFNISDEINSVISVLENNANQKDIKLYNDCDSHIMVEADRNMIRSVIQNLMTNAIKFSNSKGKVIARSRVPQTFGRSVATSEDSEREWLEISIADNGIGIPEEIIPKLFKLNGQYSQAGTANEPGTGLGLVLCHEMVEKNGGRIWAESIAGQGTTFIFTLPLSN